MRTSRTLTRVLLLPTVLAAVAAGSSLTTTAALAAPAADTAVAHRAPAPAWNATLAISRTVIDSGQRVVLSGKVTPAVKGAAVTVQKRLAGKKWVNETKVKTSATGAYRYADMPRTAGKRSYRVVVQPTRTRSKGTSRTVALTIFRWLDLTKVASRSSSGTRSLTSIAINGVAYDRGFAGYPYYNTGFVDWNFAKRCTSLTARFGNGDRSDDTATAGVELVVDGTPVYTESFGLTQSSAKVFNISTAFRVAFKWTSSNVGETPADQAGAEAVMVVPQVRCSF